MDNGPSRDSEASHIVIAARAYSKGEEKQINESFTKQGHANYRVSPSMALFDSVKEADLDACELLKEMFADHLPKMPEPEPVVDEEMATDEKQVDGEPDVKRESDLVPKSESDDGLFGTDSVTREPVAVKKSSSINNDNQKD